MTDSKIKNYYVDEAGDGTIFDAKGRIIIGKEGCSRFFMLGLLDNCYRYNINELYDFLIRQLFQGRLHQHDAYKIHFAKRGKADRTEALKVALDAARQRFAQKYGKTSSASINVLASVVLQQYLYIMSFRSEARNLNDHQ